MSYRRRESKAIGGWLSSAARLAVLWLGLVGGMGHGAAALKLEETNVYKNCLLDPDTCRQINVPAFQPSLTGTVPASISQLTNLVDLLIYTNALTGTLPAEVFALPRLRGVDVRNNQLSGLPLGANGFLSFCANKLRLDLSNNLFSGFLGEFTSCIGMERLDLSNNRFSGTIPASVGAMTLLTVLNVHKNKLSGALPNSLGQCVDRLLPGCLDPAIPGLSRLRTLQLNENDFNGTIPENLGFNRGLSFLDISETQVSGVIPDSLVTQTTALRHLDLDSTQLEGTLTAALKQGLATTAFRVSLCNTKYTFSRASGQDGYTADGVWKAVPFVVPSFDELDFDPVNNAADF
eukprot:CAMPEP_0198207104 /NCGR_PEP_ID=MMETSP1445-20131203/10581_1 /TAXON_ID=36898 /ORGANISM="Pyramimonas sp., Strain CCMP2087" /LENGTH=347 /DNA_ID=CAMNT_0043880013 /DNA_START=246 /DNA_END=1286 /DNA_ORIENTATION=-